MRQAMSNICGAVVSYSDDSASEVMVIMMGSTLEGVLPKPKMDAEDSVPPIGISIF